MSLTVAYSACAAVPPTSSVAVKRIANRRDLKRFMITSEAWVQGSDFHGKRCKLVGADAPAFVKAHLLMGRFVFRRPVAGACGVACLSPFLFQVDGGRAA